MRVPRPVVVVALFAIAWAATAQQTTSKSPISRERLVEVLANVQGWAEEAAAARKAAAGLSPGDLVKRTDAIRVKFDPVMVLMATTEPPAEVKQAAVLLLMAAKGVELALWHYLYAGIANHAASVDHGDAILKVALGQLAAAEVLFAR